MPNLLSIITAVESALVGVAALGASRVSVGHFIPERHSGSAPWARVGPPASFSTQDADTIGLYRRRAEIPVLLAAAGTSPQPRDQVTAVVTLLDSCLSALEADRSLGGLVIDLHVSGESLGIVQGLPGLSVALIAVEVYYDIDTGV